MTEAIVAAREESKAFKPITKSAEEKHLTKLIKRFF